MSIFQHSIVLGFFSGSAHLSKNGYAVNLTDLKTDDITLMKPFCTFIGVIAKANEYEGLHDEDGEDENTRQLMLMGKKFIKQP